MKLPSTAGVRRKVTNEVLRQIFEHWNEVEPGTAATRGQHTLTHLYRTEPTQYARLIAALLPRDVVVDAVGDMSDEDLDALIDNMRLRLEQQRALATKPILIEAKNGR
jgi:hypothetical protein